MKKSDKQIYGMLRSELESIEIPESMGKEKIVDLLKKQKDFSDETGNIISIDAKRDNASGKSTALIGKAAAMAAALAVVVASALFISNRSKVDVIKTDPAYENHSAAKLIVGAKSYDEVENAIQQILSKPSSNGGESITQSGEPSTSGNPGNSGLSGYIAQPADSSDKNESSLISVEEFTGFEADIVKNNGQYLFVVASEDSDGLPGSESQVIKTVKASPASEMSVVSTIVLADNSNPHVKDKCIEIHLRNNVLVAVMERKSSIADTDSFNKDLTVAIYYDITNPESPLKLREHIQDGKYITSSLNKNILCLITDKPITASENISLPSYTINGVLQMPEAEEIFMSVNDPEASYIFITSTDIDELSAPVDCIAFLGGNGNGLYNKGNDIIIARNFISVEADENGTRKTLTELYHFDISAKSKAFSGSFAINGTLCNEPLVDKENGNIIAAATDNKSTSIYILSKNMKLIGKIDSIFPGEKIKNVIYLGSTCYVTSDKDEETTLIIDLSDPAKPVEKATVSTEGLASTIYKAGDDFFFTISGLEDSGLILSSLDLNNPESIKDGIYYNVNGVSDSEALTDSKTVMVIEDKKIFGIPVIDKSDSGLAYALFDYSEGSIKSLGYFSNGLEITESHAIRGTCIEDTLYIVAGDRIVAFSISDKTLISSIELN